MKKILILTTICTLSLISFSEVIDSAELEKLTNAINQGMQEREKIKNIEGTNLSFYADANKNIFDNLNDIYRLVDDKVELAFNVLEGIGNAATMNLSGIGSLPFMGGVAVLGTNIQHQLNRVLHIRDRVDNLKKYKRELDQLKLKISKDILKNKLLSDYYIDITSEQVNKQIDNILSDYDDFRKNRDETPIEANKALYKSIDKTAQEINRVKNEFAKSISNLDKINPQSNEDHLTKLESQLSLLIRMTNTMLQQQAMINANEIEKYKNDVDRRIKDEIAYKNMLAENKRLSEQREREFPNSALGTKFAGDIWNENIK